MFNKNIRMEKHCVRIQFLQEWCEFNLLSFVVHSPVPKDFESPEHEDYDHLEGQSEDDALEETVKFLRDEDCDMPDGNDNCAKPDGQEKTSKSTEPDASGDVAMEEDVSDKPSAVSCLNSHTLSA